MFRLCNLVLVERELELLASLSSVVAVARRSFVAVAVVAVVLEKMKRIQLRSKGYGERRRADSLV